MARAYVALGSNLGDREATIRAAVAALGAEPVVEVLAVSSLIETDPVGHLDQPPFLNGALALETSLEPRALLDLLLYENRVVDEPGLRIPHPRLHERAFVLGPLAELDMSLEVPGKGDIQSLLAGLH